MTKTIQYTLIAAGLLGAVLLSNRAAVADGAKCPMCSMGSMGCCGGMSQTATAVETNTNTVPDLLTTCPVSGDKLDGDMGKPYVFIYQGQEVKLCCKACKKDFDKNPDKYVAKIRAGDKK